MKKLSNREKNYYIYKAEWIPDNPVATFIKFVEHLISSENIKQSKIEALSNAYQDKFGYKLPLFILRPILSEFERKEYAVKKRNEWFFTEKIPSHDYEIVSGEFQKMYTDLINGFVQFVNSEKLSYEKAENVITEFIEENDITFKTISTSEYEEGSAFFQLAQYLKYIQQSNNNLFSFIIHLCEATLIKSYILNEDCQEFSFSNKTIVLDTPLVLRVLGYVGEYFETEYTFLLKCLLSGACKLSIFSHTYSEISDILYSAKEWVERADFDIEKASEVCYYFRSKGMTQKDVISLIENLKENLLKLNISIVNDELIDWSKDKFVESNKEIEDLLKNNYNMDLIRERSINYDIRSILSIYLLRGNNKIKTLKDSTHFFLTSNGALAKSVLFYNAKHYPKTLSPVATDMFIGMLSCGENIQAAKKITGNKVLSYCYSGFKPTKAMKEKFVALVEAEKDHLHEKNYLLLKNHPLVCDALLSSSNNNINNITELTVYDVLDSVQSSLVEDTKRHYDIELQKKDQQIQELNKEKEINRKNHLEEIHNINIQYAREDWGEWKQKAKTVKTLVSILTSICVIISSILGWKLDAIPQWGKSLFIVGCIFSIILVPSSIMSWLKNNFFIKGLYNKKKIKLSKKYNIKVEELED